MYSIFYKFYLLEDPGEDYFTSNLDQFIDFNGIKQFNDQAVIYSLREQLFFIFPDDFDRKHHHQHQIYYHRRITKERTI